MPEPTYNVLQDQSQLLTYLQAQYKRISALESALVAVTKPANASMNGIPLTQAQLNQIRQSLTANGVAQLNVQSLLGVLAQVQNAAVPRVDALPSNIDPLFQNSAAVVFNNVLYSNDGTAWIALNGGTVTSVDADGGATGFDFTGGPITNSGTLTMVVSDAATVRAAIGVGGLSVANAWTALNTFSKTIIGHRQTYTGIVGTTTFDLAEGNVIEFTFGAGNETIALSNIKDGTFYSITMIQDAGGSRTATWPATIKWAAGSAPTLSTGAGQRDVFLFYSNGTNLYEMARRPNVS